MADEAAACRARCAVAGRCNITATAAMLSTATATAAQASPCPRRPGRFRSGPGGCVGQLAGCPVSWARAVVTVDGKAGRGLRIPACSRRGTTRDGVFPGWLAGPSSSGRGSQPPSGCAGPSSATIWPAVGRCCGSLVNYLQPLGKPGRQCQRRAGWQRTPAGHRISERRAVHEGGNQPWLRPVHIGIHDRNGEDAADCPRRGHLPGEPRPEIGIDGKQSPVRGEPDPVVRAEGQSHHDLSPLGARHAQHHGSRDHAERGLGPAYPLTRPSVSPPPTDGPPPRIAPRCGHLTG